MTNSNDSNKKTKSFMDSFREGYDEQDRKVAEDKAPIEDKIVEGLVTGTVETVAHPFRWLRKVLK